MKKRRFLFLLCIGFCIEGCSCNNQESSPITENLETQVIGETTSPDKQINIKLETKPEETTSKVDINLTTKPKETVVSSEGIDIVFKNNTYESGSVELQNYKGLKHNIPEIEEVTEDDVLNSLDSYYNNVFAFPLIKSGQASVGDYVNISFLAKDSVGNILDKSGEKGTNLLLGEYQYYEGLDEYIYGMNVGDTKTFEIDYDKEYYFVDNILIKDRVVTFEVTLNGIYNIEYDNSVTVGTDDYVEKYLFDSTGCLTVAELKDYIREELEKARKDSYKENVENIILTELLDDSEILDYPEDLGQAYYDDFWEQIKQNARDESLTLDDYLSLLNTTYNNLDERLSERASNCVQADVILSNIASLENLNSKEEALAFLIENSVYDEEYQPIDIKEFYDYKYIKFSN